MYKKPKIIYIYFKVEQIYFSFCASTLQEPLLLFYHPTAADLSKTHTLNRRFSPRCTVLFSDKIAEKKSEHISNSQVKASTLYMSLPSPEGERGFDVSACLFLSRLFSSQLGFVSLS